MLHPFMRRFIHVSVILLCVFSSAGSAMSQDLPSSDINVSSGSPDVIQKSKEYEEFLATLTKEQRSAAEELSKSYMRNQLIDVEIITEGAMIRECSKHGKMSSIEAAKYTEAFLTWRDKKNALQEKQWREHEKQRSKLTYMDQKMWTEVLGNESRTMLLFTANMLKVALKDAIAKDPDVCQKSMAKLKPYLASNLGTKSAKREAPSRNVMAEVFSHMLHEVCLPYFMKSALFEKQLEKVKLQPAPTPILVQLRAQTKIGENSKAWGARMREGMIIVAVDPDAKACHVYSEVRLNLEYFINKHNDAIQKMNSLPIFDVKQVPQKNEGAYSYDISTQNMSQKLNVLVSVNSSYEPVSGQLGSIATMWEAK